MRSELSKKNEYWIPKLRYHELRYFCLQYTYYDSMCVILQQPYYPEFNRGIKVKKSVDVTQNQALKLAVYRDKLVTISETAKKTDPDLWFYILEGVTKGLSYDLLLANYEIPCCREVYYKLYRKFFWLLDKEV